ncbi:MAG: MurT ligase domain-containing protein [Erysipelotrichaceae bacterium]
MGKLKFLFRKLFKLNTTKFRKLIKEIHDRSGKNSFIVAIDMIYCSLAYSAGIMDYYHYGFETLSRKDRKCFITIGINHSYIRKVNDPNYGYLIDDKIVFNETFREFIGRNFLDLKKASYEEFVQFVKDNPILILKPVDLDCGKDVEKVVVDENTNIQELYNSCINKGQLLVEECLKQHPVMSQLSPYSINTLRIVTANINDHTTVLFRSVRIGTGNNIVDNFHNGGIFSILNQYGKIDKPALNIEGELFINHPNTNTKFEGFTIPYYYEAIELCKKASKVVPQVGYIGWDVAITPNGPVLIEGNHIPCYELFQSRYYFDIDHQDVRGLFDEVILGKKKGNKLAFGLALFIYKIFLFGQKIIKDNNSYARFTKIIITICPQFLSMLDKPKTVICVTGTNGKTTLCGMLEDTIKKCNKTVVNNDGYNYKSGIIQCFAKATSLFNKCSIDYAVIEVDELTSKEVYEYLTPDYLIITNLFRDSIIRNANIDYIFDVLKTAIPKKTKLILNADDIISSQLKNENTTFFAIDKLSSDTKECINIVRDITICPNCQSQLEYEYNRYNHLGKLYCPNCDFKSQDPKYLLKDINEDNIVVNGEVYPIVSSSIFNIYNELAAISLFNEVGEDLGLVKKALGTIKIINSRERHYNVGDKELVCILAKGQNPVAVSSVIRYVTSEKGSKDVILMLDDIKIHIDSTEIVAWLYDTDFELFNKDDIRNIILAGPRCYDMQVRLLMAGVDSNKIVMIEKQEDVVNIINMDGIDKLYLLYDIVARFFVLDIEKSIVEKYGDK